MIDRLAPSCRQRRGPGTKCLEIAWAHAITCRTAPASTGHFVPLLVRRGRHRKLTTLEVIVFLAEPHGASRAVRTNERGGRAAGVVGEQVAPDFHWAIPTRNARGDGTRAISSHALRTGGMGEQFRPPRHERPRSPAHTSGGARDAALVAATTGHLGKPAQDQARRSPDEQTWFRRALSVDERRLASQRSTI